MHSRRHRLNSVALLALCLSACGQTGPLYLPERTDPVSVPPAAASGAAETEETQHERQQRSRRGTHDAPASDTHTPVNQPDPAQPSQSPPSDNR
ncbi:MAG: lipoprotein [Gammaproteobacteria bacterium]|nr:hypothetical protein [Gammaproteobacteria bacterium]